MPPYAKHPAARRGKHSPSTTATTLVATEIELPELPTRYKLNEKTGERTEAKWHPMAVQTWEEIWRSPMVEEYLETDFAAFRQLLALETAFWEKAEVGKTSAEMSETITRLRKQLGLTPMGRRSLEWVVEGTAALKDRHRAAPRPVDVEGTCVELVPTTGDGDLLS